MPTFKDTMLALCQEKHVTVREAIEKAAPYLMADHIEEHILYSGEDVNLDMTTLQRLAAFFNTGIDTFIPGYTLKAGGAKTYLCGPVTRTAGCMDRFAEAQAYLESMGRNVFNPAKTIATLPLTDVDERDIISLRLALLRMCGEIAVMPGWNRHAGCVAEHAYAEVSGYKIVELANGHLSDGRRLLDTSHEH